LPAAFNGYLADENYFAGCGGGGGSSSTSSLDSTTIANMIAAAGGGCNFKYPDGFNGEYITESINPNNSNQNNYIVPTGKILYINTIWKSSASTSINFTINGIELLSGSMNDGNGGSISSPFILNGGDILEGTISFNGILITNSNITSITHSLSNFGQNTDYVVPNGKSLHITQVKGSLVVNGVRLISSSNDQGSYYNLSLANVISVSAGDVISGLQNNDAFNGYLVDENYFAGCGGGGSSSSASGTMSVSTFGDTLTMNGQSIIVPGISFSNVVPVFGSVTDIDGNTYQTVSYGGLEWMSENLTTATFSNGTPISEICNCGSNINSMCSQPGWCNYNGDITYNAQYGKLYNGYAINNSNVCPTGWHVSTSADWDIITDLFVTSGSVWSNNGTDGVGSTSGNASSLLLSQTNESYLSLQLGGQNGPTGSGSFMGSQDSYWLSNAVSQGGGTNWPDGNACVNIYNSTTPSYHVVNLGSASFWDYKYVRCVKD